MRYMSNTETCTYCGEEADLMAHPCEIAMDADYWEWRAEDIATERN